MFVYFAVLLVLCKRGNSLETTTSPQQQTGRDTKVLCEVPKLIAYGRRGF